MTRPQHALLSLLALAFALPLAGCGGGAEHGVELHDVSGTVLQDGRPLAGADVRFYATDAAQRRSGVPIPKGQTDDAGRFELRTFDPGDGAPEGEYAVTVTKPEPYESPEGAMEERDTLRDAYANPDRPAATVTVTAGSNSLTPIEL